VVPVQERLRSLGGTAVLAVDLVEPARPEYELAFQYVFGCVPLLSSQLEGNMCVSGCFFLCPWQGGAVGFGMILRVCLAVLPWCGRWRSCRAYTGTPCILMIPLACTLWPCPLLPCLQRVHPCVRVAHSNTLVCESVEEARRLAFGGGERHKVMDALCVFCACGLNAAPAPNPYQLRSLPQLPSCHSVAVPEAAM
jgi:hypothetical protein